MRKTKILLIGNSSCVNRGDAAILDGLIHGIKEVTNKNNIEITATSVQYFESRILLKYPLEPDFSYSIKPKLFGEFSLLNKIRNKYFLFLEILILSFFAKNGSKFIPRRFREVSKNIEAYDIVIQVGGSYFVDLYTPMKYISVAISILLKKPIFFAGHSIGPFESWKSKLIPRLLFNKVDKIYLREEESMKYISSLNTDYSNISISGDTAWLIAESKRTLIFHEEVKTSKPLIAITVRDLKPFDKRLNIKQEEYENLYVDVLNELIREGYHIIAVSMGTGFGKYAHDDRIPAFRIKSKLENCNEMTVLVNEYNHLEVGYILSNCDLLIGTRLHSVILSMRYNTPAIAVYYEHKSLGILNKMGFEKNSFFIKDIGNDLFNIKVKDILNNQIKYRIIVEEKVNQERKLGLKMLTEIFK